MTLQNQITPPRQHPDAVGLTVEDNAPPLLEDADYFDWIYGSHAPTGRMGGYAKLARLLTHTPLTGIDGRTAEFVTGVPMNGFAAAFRDSRVMTAAEARGWVKTKRMGPLGAMRTYLASEAASVSPEPVIDVQTESKGNG